MRPDTCAHTYIKFVKRTVSVQKLLLEYNEVNNEYAHAEWRGQRRRTGTWRARDHLLARCKREGTRTACFNRHKKFNTTHERDERITRQIAPTLQWRLHAPVPLQVGTIAQPRHRPEQHLDLS